MSDRLVIVADDRVMGEIRRDARSNLTLAYDASCNLSCPSCRTNQIMARKHERDRLDQFAELIVFLSSPAASKITGQVISVNGGVSAG